MSDLPPELLDVTAIIVTRGDQDLQPVYTSLSMMGEIMTWNNGELFLEIANIDGVRRMPAQIGWGDDSTPRDLSVYGRYAAMKQARFQTVYVQDDDCVLPSESIYQLIDTFNESDRMSVTINLPDRFRGHYSDTGLVGFGAVMDTDVPEVTFGRFLEQIGDRELDLEVFLRRCDHILTTLRPLVLCDVPYEDLPWASAPGRMWTTPGHTQERDEILALARQIRDELQAAA